jgi:exosortase/archaeosortase family protein
MASIFLGELYRLKLGGRSLVVAVGIVVAFLLNVLRTSFLSWQGAFHGIESTEKWHDAAGFTILGVVLLCLFGISQLLEKNASRPGASPSGEPTQESR